MKKKETDIKSRDIRIIRIYFLVLIGGMGAANPFLNLYMSRQHFSGAEIGLVISIGSVIGLFAAPFWTRIHMESRYPIKMLSVSLIMSGIATVLFGYQTAFLGMAVFYCLRTLFNAGHFTTADMLALRAIDGTRVGYGSIRLWGSLGWSVVVLLTGWMNGKFSIRSGFFLYAAMNLIAVLVLTQLSPQNRSASAPVNAGVSRYFSGIVDLFRNPALSGFGLMTIITAIGNLGVLNYETIYLDKLGASDSIIGVACMVSAVVEVPMMLISDKMIRRFGPIKVIRTSLFVYSAVRLVVLLFPSVTTVILMRALGGIAFSLLTIGQVVFINMTLHSEKAGTALVIFTITIPTLINILLTPLFGSIYDNLGAGWLYLISMSGYLLGALIYNRYYQKHPVFKN